MNFICTILDENYWNPWGVSWISSLLEFTDTRASVLVVNCGLSAKSVKKLDELGATVLPSVEVSGYHERAVRTLRLFDKGDGKYLFFDADVWFQLPVDELFERIDDSFMICKNMNYGFLGFSSDSFAKLDMVQKFCQQAHDTGALSCLTRHFPNYLAVVDNKYNCCNLPELRSKDGMLALNDEPQHAIHFQGILKGCSAKKNLLYHERYPDLFSKYCESRKFVSRMVVSKQDSVVNHNQLD